MKLLFDANISYRILKKIKEYFPDCQHVSNLSKNNLKDFAIWEYAKSNNYIIVSFDQDFYDMQLLFDFPPKIVWLRTGNLTTNMIADLLIERRDIIADLNRDSESGILEIIY